MAQAGDMEGGLTFVRRAIELQPGWRELLDRLSPEIAPSAAGVAAALYRSPGVFFGYSETGVDRSSAVWMMRLCSAMWAAG